MAIEYTIRVFEEGGRLVADVDGDGFQTLLRARCRAKATRGRLELYLERYRDGNGLEPYRAGDRLLTLSRSRGRLLTFWGALAPQLGRRPTGRVYFEAAPGRR
jgi:hypothetical protein